MDKDRYSFEMVISIGGGLRRCSFFDHKVSRMESIGMTTDLDFATRVVTALNWLYSDAE